MLILFKLFKWWDNGCDVLVVGDVVGVVVLVLGEGIYYVMVVGCEVVDVVELCLVMGKVKVLK